MKRVALLMLVVSVLDWAKIGAGGDARVSRGGDARPAAVEKDGVVFELLVPERTWSTPDPKPNASLPVKVALEITNKTAGTPRLREPAQVFRGGNAAAQSSGRSCLGWPDRHPAGRGEPAGAALASFMYPWSAGQKCHRG